MNSSENHANSHHGSATPEPDAPPSGKGKSGVIWVLVVIVAALVAYRIVHRVSNDRQVAAMTRELAVPTVQTMLPQPSPSLVNLDLPGDVAPFQQTAIYARTNGYIQRWLVDIGTRVASGQLLAEIDAPDLDQQIRQAQANVTQAQVNLGLAKVTADRWVALLKQNVVDQQTTDEKTAAYTAAIAALDASKAALATLQATKSFQKVTAPFAGTITARTVNVGDLVSSTGGNTGSTATELFVIQQDDPLRVYVNVPETVAADVKVDASATAAFASNNNRPVEAKVARTANAIDPSSRTLLVEIDVPNPDHKLLPGGYAQVRFPLVIAQPRFVLPVNTLLFRADGTQVGVVGDDNHIIMKKVKIGKDYGTTAEIIAGLAPTDRVVLNPADSLTAGDQVRIDDSQLVKPAAK